MAVRETVYRVADIEDRISETPDRRELFGNPDFCELLFDHIDRLTRTGDVVLSLDIFDTLLLRDDTSELRRFYEIGGLMSEILMRPPRGIAIETSSYVASVGKKPIDAFLARHLGTKASYRARELRRSCREGSLNEIHNVASRLLTGTSVFRDLFVECELNYEATKLIPNESLMECVRRYKKKNGKVILITDMYMHEYHIKKLLAILNVDASLFTLIRSSADLCVSKASGGIFKDIEDELELAPRHFLHLGDNFHGDFKQPKRQGWQAIHLPLGSAEIKKRRADHFKMQSFLSETYSIAIDVAIPH